MSSFDMSETVKKSNKAAMLTKVVALACLISGVFGISINVTVDGLGNVVGTQETTKWSERTIFAFRGIPYAEPPIGDLRFRPPVKIATWKGELNGTKFGNVCPQSPHISTILRLSGENEDCLTLNVYVPEVEDDHPALPVMIFLHGGSFMNGFAQISEPHYILEEDVILVVPQFRLGPFGLLCLQTDEVPGNVQFLDQIMAMRWVQDHIHHFGGDPERVTLFGQSSGAASVNLHQFSPLSKGLFHQAIMQSGSAFTGWAIDNDPVQSARNIGNMVECEQTDLGDLAACLKALDVKTILESFTTYIRLYRDQSYTTSWGNKAVVQTAGSQRFLEEHPSDLLARREYSSVPMMGGITKHEGSPILAVIYYNTLLLNGLHNDTDFLKYDLIPYITKFFGENDQTGGLTQTLTNTYFLEDEIGNLDNMIPGLVDICSLLTIKAGLFRMLQANSRLNTTYLYSLNYSGTKSTWYITSVWPTDEVVPHGDDLIYLFPLFDNLSEDDVIVAKRMVKMWTSFAATGRPMADGQVWEPMSTPFGPYLIIDDELSHDRNYLTAHTVGMREGFNPGRKSLASNSSPESLAIFVMMLWSIIPR